MDRQSRILKTTIGVCIALLGSYFGILRTFVWTISTDATITSRLVPVTSPVDGYVTSPRIAPGSIVEEGQTLGEVVDPQVDTRDCDDLEAKKAALVEEVSSLRKLLDEIGDLDRVVHRDANHYKQSRLASLAALREEALARAEQMRVQQRLSMDVAERTAALTPEGLASGKEAADARSGVESARQQLIAAEKAVEDVDITIRSLQRGVDLQSLGNDKPYSERQADSLRLQTAQLRSELSERQGRLAAVSGQLDSERRRLNRVAKSNLEAPARGLVLDIAMAGRSYFRKGEAVFSLLACDNSVVVASLSERHFGRIRRGTAATIKFPGGATYQGQVINLVGKNAGLVEHGSGDPAATVALPEKLTDYLVLVSFPTLANEVAKTCEVGRIGEVRFRP